MSGPPLVRPPSAPVEYQKLLKSAKESELERIPIEGEFGNGKHHYGCGMSTTKLKNTSEISIVMTVMDLEKIAKKFLLFLFSLLHKNLIYTPNGKEFRLNQES